MSTTVKIAIAAGVLGVGYLFLRSYSGAGLPSILTGASTSDALATAPGSAPPATSGGGTGIGSKILSIGKSTVSTFVNPLTPIKLTAQLTSASAHYTASAVSGAVGAVKGVAGSVASGASSIFHSIF